VSLRATPYSHEHHADLCSYLRACRCVLQHVCAETHQQEGITQVRADPSSALHQAEMHSSAIRVAGAAILQETRPSGRGARIPPAIALGLMAEFLLHGSEDVLAVGGALQLRLRCEQSLPQQVPLCAPAATHEALHDVVAKPVQHDLL